MCFMGLTNPPVSAASLAIQPIVNDSVTYAPDAAHEQEAERAEQLDTSSGPTRLSRQDLKKVHLKLKHGTGTAVRDYVRSVVLWHADLDEVVRSVITNCGCRLGDPPTPHPKVAARPPTDRPQALVSIDVIKLEGKDILHSVDECTSLSEAAHIFSKSMECQSKVFYNMHVLRHGPPLSIRCDNKYNNGPFADFCKTMDIALLPMASNDHEDNGLIENANRILRRCFNRIRSCDQSSSCEAVVAEAVFGKNVIIGSNQASVFELLYQRRPPIIPELDANLPPSVSVHDHVQQLDRRRLLKMLRSRTYEPENFQVDDRVAIYRDGSGWLRPARVVEVTPHYVIVKHNGRRKSSGLNRTRLLGSTFNNDEPPRDSTAQPETLATGCGNWAEDDVIAHVDAHDDGDNSTDGEVDLPASTPSTDFIPFDEPTTSRAPTVSSVAQDTLSVSQLADTSPAQPTPAPGSPTAPGHRHLTASSDDALHGPSPLAALPPVGPVPPIVHQPRRLILVRQPRAQRDSRYL